MDDAGFLLGIEVMCRRFELPLTGGFRDMWRPFYNCYKQMYDFVHSVAMDKNIYIDTILAMEMASGGNHRIQVQESMAQQMLRFNVVQQQTLADRRRIRTLHKRLTGILGEVPDPFPAIDTPAPADVQQNVESHQLSQGAAPGGQNSTSPPPGQLLPSNKQTGITISPEQHAPSSPKTTECAPQHTKGTDSDPVPIDNGISVSQTEPVKRKTRTRRKRNRTKDLHDSDTEWKAPRRSTKRSKIVPQTSSNRGEVDIGNADEVADALEGMDTTQLRSILGRLGFDLVPNGTNVPQYNEEFENGDELGFEDHLPVDLPLHIKDPLPFTGAETPVWCRYLTERPGAWPALNPIRHPSPWLNKMCIPAEHRANVAITDVNILRTNHHSVYWRASFNICAHIPPHEMTAHQKFGRRESLHGNQLRWAHALTNDANALYYFGNKRGELMQKGFCVLEGFLDDSRMPERIGELIIPKVQGDGKFFINLHRHMDESFPGEEVHHLPGNRKEWDTIVNGGGEADMLNREKGIERYITTHYGVTEAIERNPARVWACTARALLDARICQSMAALQTNNHPSSGTGMYVPRTGGRWLYTSKGCERQSLHTDFQHLPRKDTLLGKGNPGYFAICSADKEIPLWVCSHSHHLVSAAPTSALSALSYGTITLLEKIPPFSIFFGRGDLYHAGAASADTPEQETLLRYHLYFVPEDFNLPGGIQIVNQFQPQFRSEVTESDKEGPIDSGLAMGTTQSLERIEQNERGMEGAEAQLRPQEKETAPVAGNEQRSTDEETREPQASERVITFS